MIVRQALLASAATALGLIVLGPGRASAQVVTAPSPGSPPGSATQSAPSTNTSGNQTAAGAVNSSSSQLAEVIVTANKRSESINKVSMSITAVSADTLKQQNITSAGDLSRLVPGFNVTTASFGTEVYTIRGVGFYDTTLAAVPAVSVYVDEVPLPFAVMATGASLDPQRVEVLLGPQGTLFGQNSTGGAINWIAAKPTSTFQSGVTETFGNYSTFNTDAFISGPLTNTVQARLSFRDLTSNSGWQQSVTRDDHIGRVDTQEARLLIDWKPFSKLQFELNLNGFNNQSDTQAPRYLGYALNIPSLAFAVPQLTNAPVTTGSDKYADWDAGKNYSRDDREYAASLRTDYQVAEKLSLTNIASYSHYAHDQFQDLDGLSITNLNQDTLGAISSYYDELRLSGSFNDHGRFVIGGDYQYSKVSQTDQGLVDVYTTSFAPVYLAGLPRFNNFTDLSDQTFRSEAIFGNVDYDIASKITLHGGVRYTDTRVADRGCTTGDFALNAIAGSTNPPGQCLTLSAAGVSELVVSSLDEDNVSWRAGVDYKPISNALFYVNASRGFKAQGYPVLAASAAVQIAPAKQEELTAYEGGLKINFVEYRLLLTGAGFYYDYMNKQIRGRINDPAFGLLETLLNIPKSNVRGAELNAQWRPLQGLTVNGGASYAKSEIEHYSNLDVTSNPVDLNGKSFPNAPAFEATFASQYDAPLSTRFRGFVGVNYNYDSSTRGTLGFNPQLKIPSYALIGLQAGIRPTSGDWRLSAFVKNLTDRFYYTGTNRGGEALIGFAGMPRTFGLSLTYNFQ